MRDKYELTDKSKEKKTKVSRDQFISGINGNIREAVLNYDKNAYDGYFNMIENKSPEDNTIPLHHSFGTKASLEGRVVSFNVAGSSFSQPLRYEKGAAGKTNVFLHDGEKLVHIKEGKRDRTYTFEKQDHTTVTLSGEEVTRHSLSVVEETYGKKEDEVFNKDDIRVKKDPEERKIKYSISGPKISVLGIVNNTGMLNAGEYSIEKTREYIYTLGKKSLDKLFHDEEFMKSGEPITFTFTGHSRGGVGVLEGAMRLKYLINHEYQDLKDRVRFSTLLYDPVPGPKARVRSNINQSVNLKEQTREMKDLNMEPFGENDHTTVMYSMGCNHVSGFAPMKVLGADTIIITGHSHDEGLKDVEEQFGEKKRQAYINAQNGEAYRASGLMEMPKGIFISDENNVMVSAKNVEMVEKVFSETYIGTGLESGNTRKRRILEACTDLHMRNGGEPTLNGIVRGFNTHDPFYVISSDEFSTMRKGFFKLLKQIRSSDRDSVAIMKTSTELRKSALEYIKSKDGAGPHSNRTQGRLNTAKSIIAFLDRKREKEAKLYFDEKLDDIPKTDDMRKGFLASVLSSLVQNQEYMNRMCERYSRCEPVETDMFNQTLSSMLADRFFVRAKDKFMPEPIKYPKEQQIEIEKIETVLGDGKDSLYEVFSKSPAVNKFASEIIAGRKTDEFRSIHSAEAALDSIITQVSKELTQKNAAPENKAENVKTEENPARQNSNNGFEML